MDNSIARFQISADEDFRVQFVFVGLSLAGRTLRILVKERASNVLRTTLTLGAGLTLDGTDTVTALVPQATASAWAKGEFETDLHDITGGANTRLVGARTLYDLPGKLPYGVIGAKATVQWVVNKAVVTAIGGIGPTGPANTLTIGTVETLPVGSPATAEITGAAPSQTLNLGIPTGATGNIGPAGTITVGTVTTGAPGTDVIVTNVGTAENAILNFTIPEGEQGIQGLTGNKGWSPAFAIVSDGARRVLRVSDWVGGEGVKPATGDYVGAAGLTPTIGDAIDIRGPAGTATIPDGNKGDITTSAGGDTWEINGGYVPKTGGVYEGNLAIERAYAEIRLKDTGAAVGRKSFALASSAGYFHLAIVDDAGGYISSPLIVDHATGAVGLSVRPNWGATPYDTTNLVAFTGDSGSGGEKGLVPAPAAGDATKFLRGDGSWAALPSQIPPGMTATFAMSSPPAGWLAEDGSAVSVTTYAALDAAIYCGNANNATAAWGYRCTNPANPSGTRSTSGTHIVLRDMRGEFQRGWDNGRGIDSGRSLWSSQAATQIPNLNTDSSSVLNVPKGTAVGESDGAAGGSITRSLITLTDNATVTRWQTVRPRNLAGLPCIKY